MGQRADECREEVVRNLKCNLSIHSFISYLNGSDGERPVPLREIVGEVNLTTFRETKVRETFSHQAACSVHLDIMSSSNDPTLSWVEI